MVLSQKLSSFSRAVHEAVMPHLADPSVRPRRLVLVVRLDWFGVREFKADLRHDVHFELCI